MNFIHPTALVDPLAELGEGNTIGPYCLVGASARLGDNNWFGSHVVIGAQPEHRGYHLTSPSFEGPSVAIGSDNVFHEFIAIQNGTQAPTRIGDGGFFMTKVSFGHDVQVGDGVTIASGVSIAGHAWIDDGATLGLNTSVLQRTYIGMLAMVSMNSSVTGDLPPFAMAGGSPCRQIGLNETGLSRANLRGDWEKEYWDKISSPEAPGEHCSMPSRIREGFERWSLRNQCKGGN